MKNPADFGTLRKQGQNVLADFLRVDLDLAFTFIKTAEITDNDEHRDSAIQMARRALETIRHLKGRIEDPEVWREIDARANELEAALGGATEEQG